jgi:hypothetical protein
MKSSASAPKLGLALSWLIALILAVLPFHAFLTTWIGSNTSHLDLLRIWKDLLLTAMIPFGFLLMWRNKPISNWFFGSWIVRLFIVYTLLEFVLGVWALSRHQVNGAALIYALIINLRFIAFFIVCTVVATSCDFLSRNWHKILLFPAAVVVFFGLAQRFILPYDFLKHFGYSPKTIPAYQTVDANVDYHRIQSTLRGANPLGAYLVLVIPAYFVTLNKRWILRTLILIASVGALFFSYSRSAWIGAAVSFSLIFVWSITNQCLRRQVIVAGLAVIVTLVAGLYIFRSSPTVQDTFFHTSSDSTSSVSSNAARTSAIENAFKDVLHQPLGRGPGTAGPASLRNNHSSRIAEDYYLQIGQEVGVLGMALFIVINILVGIELWKKRSQILPRVLLVSLAGLTFVNMVSHAWTDDTISYLWWGLAGIALSPVILKSRHKQDEQVHSQT